MHDTPSWKHELNRRLAAIRERVGGSLRPPRPAAASALSCRRREAAACNEGKRR